MCERWSYYLPLVTKEELEGCKDRIDIANSTLVELGPKQQKIFDGLTKIDEKAFKNLKVGVPYLIGSLTNY